MEKSASYLVISRRYRPQNFEELIGQEALGQTLKNAVLQKRVAHAYLFTGPRGVGKTSAARILAKALRCGKKESGKIPCNQCPSCLEIQDGHALDVIEIDAASNTGVDNIRDLRDSVSYSASHGQFRIFIIDEVHMLSTAAFNALLKTLEEPPPHVIFVFATTEIHKVPATILSRCQRFDFKRIPKTRIVDALEKICQTEGITAEKEALLLIAEEAEGCMRDAQSLLEQAISLSGKNIQCRELEAVLGFVPRKGFFDLLRNMSRHDVAASLNLCHEAMVSGADPKVLLNRLVSTYRDLNLFKATGNFDESDLEYKNFLSEIAGQVAQDELVRAMDLCLSLQAHLTNSLDAQIALESLVIKVALQRPVLAPTPKLGSSLKSPPSPTPPQLEMGNETALGPVIPKATTEATDANLLQQLHEFLRRDRPAWLPVMKSLKDIRRTEKRFEISAEGDFAGKRLASPDGQAVLKQCFGAENQYLVSLLSSTKKEIEILPQDLAKQKLKEAKEDSVVQSALKAFKGSLSETKILDEDGEPR